jgi:hypothetical protein
LAGDVLRLAKSGTYGTVDFTESFWNEPAHSECAAIMHAPAKGDILLAKADNAIATARRLQNELSDIIAAAHAQCRRMEHWKAAA